jgi:hypothetical protein
MRQELRGSQAALAEAERAKDALAAQLQVGGGLAAGGLVGDGVVVRAAGGGAGGGR